MITITKTTRCASLINCVMHISMVIMHPSFCTKFCFDLNRQLNTYIGKIYTSTNTTPIHRHTGLLTAAETVYSILDTFVQDLLSAPASPEYMERIFSVWWVADVRAPQSCKQCVYSRNSVRKVKGKASSLDIAPLTILVSGALQPRKWQLTVNDCSTAVQAVAAHSPH